MADTRVHTIQELRDIFGEQTDRIAAIQRLLDTAELTQDRMYETGHTLAEIKTEMDSLYADIEVISDKVEADIVAIQGTTTPWQWPVEMRVGLTGLHTVQTTETYEVSFFTFGASTGIIEALNEAADPINILASTYFAIGDIVEVVGPEDKENAQIMEVASATTTSVVTVQDIPGGVDNATDRRAKVVLKIDASL